jgi:hypothetical protein
MLPAAFAVGKNFPKSAWIVLEFINMFCAVKVMLAWGPESKEMSLPLILELIRAEFKEILLLAKLIEPAAPALASVLISL